jgi:hypothetical protein
VEDCKGYLSMYGLANEAQRHWVDKQVTMGDTLQWISLDVSRCFEFILECLETSHQIRCRYLIRTTVSPG